ncbi:MAG: alpha/beta hydrolase fold domain-containing protein [Pseudomonadota bacterium]
MGLRLKAINLVLRLGVKPVLNRMKTPQDLRQRFERDAARFFQTPEDAQVVTDAIRRKGEPRRVGMIDALWVSARRPDRRKVILYLHGGAFVAGSPRTHRHLAAALSAAAGARVIVPDYRLAPEHKHPAAAMDALAAYRHLLDAGYGPEDVALAGDSAGGGLCFSVLLAARKAGLPRPAAVAAFSPWVDLTGESKSLKRNANRDVLLPVRRMEEVVNFYLGQADRRDPLASPVFAAWHNPPPALIMASKSEILADDALALAEALRAAGGDVQLELWKDLPHAWPLLTGWLEEARQAVASTGAYLARHLGADTAVPPATEAAR